MLGLRSLNSGDALYLANSDSQSSAFSGGIEPVTGRHSVILSLYRCQQLNITSGVGASGSAYPDSVSRVRPPNTTMPKTLAALARSQYATPLELMSGNLDLETASPTAGVAAVVKNDFGTAGLEGCARNAASTPEVYFEVPLN